LTNFFVQNLFELFMKNIRQILKLNF